MKNLKILSFPITGNSKYPERNLYIFKTHDVALLSWLKEKIRLDIKEDFFLLTIDNHIDLPDKSDWDDKINALKDIKKIENINHQYENIKENFNSLFQGFDVHFILTAFEIGLIEGCLIISPEKKKEDLKKRLKERYNSQSIFFKTYLSSLFYPKGYAILNDNFDPKKKDICGKMKNSNLILDLDLDYFTYGKDDRRFAICEDHFNWLLNNEEIKALFRDDALCITIALEEMYCNLGNEINCKKIFNRLMQYFQEINIIKEKISYSEVKKRLEL